MVQELKQMESKKSTIPVPPIVIIDDYDRFMPKDFALPVEYLKHKGVLLYIFLCVLHDNTPTSA